MSLPCTRFQLIVIILVILVATNYIFYTLLISSQNEGNEKDENPMDHAASLVLLFALVTSIETATWTWTCMEGRCVKSQIPVFEALQDVHKTLEICQLTCGTFGAIWPQPTGDSELSKDIIPVHPEHVRFNIINTAENNIIPKVSDLMTEITEQFLQDMKILCTRNCYKGAADMYVKIAISSTDSVITWETDESYFILTNTNGSRVTVDIQATTIFGARHALQTLFQMMTVIMVENVGYMYMIKESSVMDKPVYPHRGLLIDTSRNYLSIETIKRTVDGMGHSKLNVLHWHATDSHSFPLKLPRIPELARYGAYSSDQIYTLQDIVEIINYSKTRGVRVLMEIDSPAHAGNGWQWGESAGLGELALCVNRDPWRQYCVQPPCGQLNPVNPNTYKVLGQIYKDLVSVFPKGEVFHMGGDEVVFRCWNETKDILDYMKNENLPRNVTGFTQVWANFHTKAAQVLDNVVGKPGTPVILWSSHLTSPENIEDYLSNRKFIIQTWVESTDAIPTQLLEKHYTLIMSTKNAWYLDHGTWGSTKYYYWDLVYNNRIPSPEKGVLGGEVCMWGEKVDDSAIDGRIWPRAAAAAERMWSNPRHNATEATARFLVHRERLVKMGIRAETVTPEWCYQNDGLC